MVEFRYVSDIHVNWFMQPMNWSFLHDENPQRIFRDKMGLFDSFAGKGNLIIAGDLVESKEWDWLEYCIRILCKQNDRVIYVPGNHDFYDHSFGEYDKYKKKSSLNKLKNFYWLDNESVVIDGVKIVGSSLWYREPPDNIVIKFGDYSGQLVTIKEASEKLSVTEERIRELCNEGNACCYYDKYWLDFNSIILKSRTDIYDRNKKSIEFLNKEVDKDCLVITHTCPSMNSVHPMFRTGPSSRDNRFFVCDMEKLILEKKPKFWVHGHTHKPFDYMIGKTHVVCNPFGYYGQNENPDFSFDKKIVIGENGKEREGINEKVN